MDLDLDGFDDSLSAVLTYRKLALDNLNTLLRLLNLRFPQDKYTPNYPLTIATFKDPDGSFRAAPYVPVDGYTSVPIMFPELFAMFQKHLNSPSMAMWALLKASEKKLGEVTYSGVCENVVIHPVGRTLNQALNEAARGFDAAMIQQNSMPYGVEVMADTSGDEEEINYDEEILEKDEEINYDEDILEDQELSDEEEKDTTEIEEHTDGKIENTKQQNEVLSAFFRSLLVKKKPEQTKPLLAPEPDTMNEVCPATAPPHVNTYTQVETKSEENLVSYESYPTLELEPTPVQETLHSGTVSFGWPETSGKKKPKPTQRQMKEESIAISEQEIFDPICGTPVTDLSYSSEDEDSLPDSLPDSIIIEKKRRTAHKSIPDLTPPPPVAPRIDLVPSPFSQKSLEEFKKTEGADEYLARMKREREVEEEEERARKDEFFKVMTRIKKGYEATEEEEGAKKRTTEEEDAAPWKIRQKVITNKQEAEQGIFFSPFVPQEEAATIPEPGHKPASDVPPTPEVYVGVGDSSGKALWERRRRGKSINTSSPSIVCQVMAERSAAYKAAHLAEEEEQAREAAVQHERAAALVILRAWRRAKSQRAKEEALRKQRFKGNLQTYLQSKLEEQTNEAAERLRASKEAEAKERARQDREVKRQLQEEMERVRNWGLKKLNRPRPSDSSSANTSHNRRSSSLGDVLSNIRRGIEEKKKRAEEILVEQEKASKVDTDEAVSPIEDEHEAQRQIGLWIQQCKQAQLEGSEPPFESPNIPCIPIPPISRPAPQNFTPVFAVPTASPSPSTDHGFSIIHTPLSSPTFHEPSVIEPSDSLASYSTSINGSEIHSLRSSDDYNLEVVDTPTSSAGQEAVDTPSSSAGQDRSSSAMDYLLPPASEHSASDGGISNISSGGGRDSTGTLGDMSREQLRDEIRSVFGDALLGIVKQMGSALERNV